MDGNPKTFLYLHDRQDTRLSFRSCLIQSRGSGRGKDDPQKQERNAKLQDQTVMILFCQLSLLSPLVFMCRNVYFWKNELPAWVDLTSEDGRVPTNVGVAQVDVVAQTPPTPVHFALGRVHPGHGHGGVGGRPRLEVAGLDGTREIVLVLNRARIPVQGRRSWIPSTEIIIPILVLLGPH